MKRNAFRLSGALIAAFAVAGCTDDPTDSLRQGATQVSTSLSYVEIIIGDSVVVTAQTRDAQGNALASLPDVAAANAGVASANIDADISGRPSPETQFSILANGFGVTTITASSGGLTRDITVQTWPASVSVTGQPAAGTTVPSGGTVQLAAVAWGSGNAPFGTGNDLLTFTWSGNASAAVDSTGLASAQAPGLAIVSVVTDGPIATGQASFEVVPGPFSGAGLAGPYSMGDQVALTMGGGLLFDASSGIQIDGALAPSEISVNGAETVVTFTVENWGAGAHPIVLTGLGAAELAEAGTFDIPAAYVPNGAGAPLDITAQIPGTFFTSLGGGAALDDFFMIAPVGADLDITVLLEWPSGDMDILWVDCGFNAFQGNFTGATGANPETSSVTIPDGDCWMLWINDYDGSAQSLIRMTITSP